MNQRKNGSYEKVRDSKDKSFLFLFLEKEGLAYACRLSVPANRYQARSFPSRCDRMAGHSAVMMLYTQVSRNEPSEAS